MEWIQNVVTHNISAITGLIGVYGSMLTKRETVTERKLKFCEMQLGEYTAKLSNCYIPIDVNHGVFACRLPVNC